MILVTGAAGFIGSAFVWELNHHGRNDLILCDKLGCGNKWLNINGKKTYDWIDRDSLFEFLSNSKTEIEAVIHMGACSSTVQDDGDFLLRNNYEYSKNLWKWCTHTNVNFIYASSAATYGDGSMGYSDQGRLPDYEKLRPLNKYGLSKHLFDLWALKQKHTPPQWFGLKFFNVYGPNEYHKGNMASMVFHSFNQLRQCGKVSLFRSYREEIKDGEQKRDFVYIKDITSILYFFLSSKNNYVPSGIYNAGTGTARTFYDLALNTAQNLNYDAQNIEFTEMPEKLKGKYQYYTQAEMTKLQAAGYNIPMTTLEDGIKDYVVNYLYRDYAIL